MTIVIVLAITHLLAVGAGIYIGRHFTAKLEIVDKST